MPGGIVTRDGNAYALLAYRHPETESAYSLVYARAFAPGEAGDAQLSSWVLEGLTGRWRARRYAFDAPQCDAKTLCMRHGLQEPFAAEELAFLTSAAQPIYRAESLTADAAKGGLTVSFSLHICSFELVLLTREA